MSRLRRTADEIDAQVSALARVWRARGAMGVVELAREGNSWRLTRDGFVVSSWGAHSAAQVWDALLDMRRAAEQIPEPPPSPSFVLDAEGDVWEETGGGLRALHARVEPPADLGSHLTVCRRTTRPSGAWRTAATMATPPAARRPGTSVTTAQ